MGCCPKRATISVAYLPHTLSYPDALDFAVVYGSHSCTLSHGHDGWAGTQQVWHLTVSSFYAFILHEAWTKYWSLESVMYFILLAVSCFLQAQLDIDFCGDVVLLFQGSRVIWICGIFCKECEVPGHGEESMHYISWQVFTKVLHGHSGSFELR